MLAGLGVGAFGRGFMPDGLCELGAAEHGLPPLPAFGFGLERRDGSPSEAARTLARLPDRELARGAGPDALPPGPVRE